MRWFGVAVAAVAVVVTIVIALTSRGNGSADSEKTAPPEPTATSLGAPRDCTAKDLTVSISAPKASYVVGSPVAFSVTLSRTGSRPCLVDGSAKGTRVVITSDGNPVWSSADCASGEEMLLMGTGDEQKSTIRWSGQRSAAGCARSQPAAGAGSYQAVVVVPGAGNLTSSPFAIALTAPAPTPTSSPTGSEPAPTAGTTVTSSPTGSKPAATPAESR